MDENKISNQIHTGEIELEVQNHNSSNNNNLNESNKYNNKFKEENQEDHFYEHVNNLGKNEIHGKTNENNHDEEEDNDIRVVPREKFKIPPNLKKTFLITMMLFSIGAILIGTAFIEDIKEGAFGVSISMWTLGSIVMIPGGYYAYQFYLACKATGDAREDILAQIPEM